MEEWNQRLSYAPPSGKEIPFKSVISKIFLK
jgi:hypothetical protein